MPTFIRTEYFLFPFCYSMEEEEVPAEADEDDHEAEFIWRMWRTDSAVSSLDWPLCS